MNKLAELIRKFAITILGLSVLLLGLILIPLPGPGVLVSILGLFILSKEFEWAERHLDRAKTAQKRLMDKAKSYQKPPKKS